jgi:hypothetical protein
LEDDDPIGFIEYVINRGFNISETLI